MSSNACTVEQLVSNIGEPVHEVSHLIVCGTKAIVQQVMAWFPVLSLHHLSSRTTVLVNVDEFHLTVEGNMFADIIELFTDDRSVSQAEEAAPNTKVITASEPLEAVKSQLAIKPGPKARHIEFPELVEAALDFIKLHGYAAQQKHRDSSSTSMGVTLKQIRQHLLDVVPGLRDQRKSWNTIQELMLAPHRGSINSHRYKALLPVRVPPKRNGAAASLHNDCHYCSAVVAQSLEFAQAFESEISVIACDSMNKLNVGTLAVSRYHQIGM